MRRLNEKISKENKKIARLLAVLNKPMKGEEKVMGFNSKSLKAVRKNVLRVEIESDSEMKIELKIEKEIRKVIKGNNMKYVNKKILTVGLGLVTAYTASAAGTASGTSIVNTATVNYSVGGVGGQTPASGSDTFVVDNKVIFTVASNGNTNVVPGSTLQVLQYTLSHTGNYTGDFGLSVVQPAVGDQFDATAVSIFVENGLQAGYQSSGANQDTGTFVDNLAADGSKIIYVVSSIPIARVNGDTAIAHLVAQAKDSAGTVLVNSGADVAGTVESVLADAAGSETGSDAANDGKHSASGTYNVVSATIVVSKVSTIISDPVNLTGANRKRIPGAVIEYTITITNNGALSPAATSLAITDTLPITVDYNAGTLIVDGVAVTDASDADVGSATIGASGVVADSISASIATLAGSGAFKTIVFRATVL